MTTYESSNPKKPGWVKYTTSEQRSFWLLGAPVLGFFVGCVIGVLADAIYAGGPGFQQNPEGIAYALIGVLPLLIVAASSIYCYVLPHIWRPITFSSRRARDAYRTYHGASAVDQAVMHRAYQAVMEAPNDERQDEACTVFFNLENALYKQHKIEDRLAGYALLEDAKTDLQYVIEQNITMHEQAQRQEQDRG